MTLYDRRFMQKPDVDSLLLTQSKIDGDKNIYRFINSPDLNCYKGPRGSYNQSWGRQKLLSTGKGETKNWVGSKKTPRLWHVLVLTFHIAKNIKAMLIIIPKIKAKTSNDIFAGWPTRCHCGPVTKLVLALHVNLHVLFRAWRSVRGHIA